MIMKYLLSTKLNLGLGSTTFAVTALLFLLWANAYRLEAGAAVATGLGSDGKMHYGYAGGRDEGASSSRALGACAGLGVVHPKVIATTSKSGYGVIVRYEIADKKYDYAAAVGASSVRQALDEALRNVPAAGRHGSKLEKAWYNAPPPVNTGGDSKYGSNSAWNNRGQGNGMGMGTGNRGGR